MILMEIVNPVGVKILRIPQTATLYFVIQHPLTWPYVLYGNSGPTRRTVS